MADKVLLTLFFNINRFLSRKFGIEMTHSFNMKIGGLVEPEMINAAISPKGEIWLNLKLYIDAVNFASYSEDRL